MISLNEGIPLTIDGIKSSDTRNRGNLKIIEFHHEIDAETDAKDWKQLGLGGLVTAGAFLHKSPYS